LSHRYRLVKGAMMTFLKPESLQNCIKEMDEFVKTLLLRETKDSDTIKAVLFIKKLTFCVASNISFLVSRMSTQGKHCLTISL
jgi:hypothetical protein